MDKNKWILGLIILLLILFIWLVVVFFFSEEPSTEETPSIGNFGTSENLGIKRSEYVPRVSTPSASDGGLIIDRVNSSLETIADSEVTQIFLGPVAGYRFDERDGNMVISLVEQGTGYFYEIKAFPYEIKRISNTNIPRALEAQVGEDLTSLISFEDEVGKVSQFIFSPNNSEETSFLINPVSASLSKDNLVFTLRENDGVEGVLINKETKSRTPIWNSNFTSWNTHWGDNDSITLTTKPSSSSVGFAYLLSPNTRTISYLAGPGEGLSVLYNQASGRLLKSFDGLSYVSNSSNEEFDLEQYLLPEKCVWNRFDLICGWSDGIPRSFSGGSAVLPDSWYLGDVSFNDSIIRLSSETEYKSSSELFNLVDEDLFIDVVYPKISPDGNFLAFINKKDRSLWIASIRN